MICKNCEHKYFNNYENPKSYLNKINKNIMSEIALKNSLFKYYIDSIALSHYKNLLENLNNLDVYERMKIKQKINLYNININEYCKEFTDIMKNKSSFYLIDEIDLPYMTPIAFQSELALLADFEGNIINNVFDDDPGNRMQHIHICVFPLKTKTKVLIFIKDGDTKNRKFYKYYKKLSLEEKLYSLNYIILKCSEDWVLHPDFANEINFNNETKDVISSITRFIVSDDELKNTGILFKEYKIPTSGSLTNFLCMKINE